MRQLSWGRAFAALRRRRVRLPVTWVLVWLTAAGPLLPFLPFVSTAQADVPSTPSGSGGAGGASGQSFAPSGGVSASGALTLSYPLGMVSADYDSTGGAWVVGRTSAITRSSKFGNPRWDTLDVFQLDGRDLVCWVNCDVTGSGKTRLYQGRQQGFAKIEYVNPGTTESYWRVTGKDGGVVEYGVRTLAGHSYGEVLERFTCSGNDTPAVCVEDGKATVVAGSASNPRAWMIAIGRDGADAVRQTYTYTRNPLSEGAADWAGNDGNVYLASVASSRAGSASATSVTNGAVTTIEYEAAPRKMWSFAGGVFAGSKVRPKAVKVWSKGQDGVPTDSQADLWYELAWSSDAPSSPEFFGGRKLVGINAYGADRSTGGWVRQTSAQSRAYDIELTYASMPAAVFESAPTVVAQDVHVPLRLVFDVDSGPETYAEMIDVTGDGLPELVARSGVSTVDENLANFGTVPTVSGGDSDALVYRANVGGELSSSWQLLTNLETPSRIRSYEDATGYVSFDLMDVDGDGLVDFVKKDSSGNLQVAYHTGSMGSGSFGSYELLHALGTPAFLRAFGSDGTVTAGLLDLNGDQRLDLVLPESRSGVGDKNGDGATNDLAVKLGTGKRNPANASGGKGFASATGSLLANDPSGKAAHLEKSASGLHSVDSWMDVNADGVPDRLVSEKEYAALTNGSTSSSYANNDGDLLDVLVLYGTATGFTKPSVFMNRTAGDWLGAEDPFVEIAADVWLGSCSNELYRRRQTIQAFMDVNRDGFVDLVLSERGGWVQTVSGGTATKGMNLNASTGDNDKNDTVVLWGSSEGIEVTSAPSVLMTDEQLGPKLDGSGGVPLVDTEVVRRDYGSNTSTTHPREVTSRQLMDMDGDGVLDYVVSEQGAGTWAESASDSGYDECDLKVKDLNDDGDKVDVVMWRGNLGTISRLTKVVSPSGTVTDYTYAPIDRGASSASSAALNPDYPHGGWVVASVTTHDGFGEDRTTTYAYSGGRYDRELRLDEGFQKVVAKDVQTGVQEVAEYLQDAVFGGRVRRLMTLDAAGKVHSVSEYEYEDLCDLANDDGRKGTASIHPSVSDVYGCNVSQEDLSDPSDAYSDRLISVHPVVLARQTSYAYDGRVGLDANGDPSGTDFVARQKKLTYDKFGNVVTETDYGIVDAAGSDVGYDKTVTTLTQAYTESWFQGEGACDPEAGCSEYLIASPWRFLVTQVTTDAQDASGALVRTGKRKAQYVSGTPLVTKQTDYRDSSDTTGLSTSWTYDGSGNVLTETDPAGVVTTYAYDSTYHAFPTSVTVSAAAGTSPARSFTSTTTYDAWMRATASTDANGLTTQYGYDTFRRVVAVAVPGDTLTSPTYKADYDDDGVLPTKDDVGVRDSGGFLNTYTFSDGFGRVIATQQEAGTSATSGDSRYLTSWNWYALEDSNADGIPESVARSYLMPAWQAQMDDDTFVRASVPATGVPSVRQYWSPSEPGTLGAWVTVSTPPSGHATKGVSYRTGTAAATQYVSEAYDALGHKVARVATPAARQSVAIQYDGTASPYTERTRTTGAWVPLATTGNGQSTITDAANNAMVATANWLGQALTASDPDLGTATNAYDATNGRLVSRTDAKGQTTTFTYDGFGRPLAETRADGAVVQAYYDGDDDGDGTVDASRSSLRLAGMASKVTVGSLATIAGGFDSRGRGLGSTRTWGGNSRSFAYGYDAYDRLTQVTYPGLTSPVTRTYDEQWQTVATVTHPTQGALLQSVARDAWGRPTTVTYGNGKQTSYTYSDATGDYRLHSVDDPDVGTDANTSTFAFDVAGRLTGLQSSSGRYDRTYGYSAQDELTSVSATGSAIPAESFAYNTIGNLTSKTMGTTTASYGYGTNPAPSTVAAPKHAPTSFGDWRYAYDANGNRIASSKRVSGATSGEAWSDGQRLGYDAVNQLSGVTSGHHPGATGYWSFFEGAGTSAADVIGGVDAALTGKPTWVADGVAGPALSVDGVDDGITTASTSDEPSGNSARTLSAWVKVQSVSALAADGLSSVVGYGGASSGYVGLAVGTDGKVRWVVDGEVGATSSGTSVRAGEWTHVAATYATDKTVTFYVNGEAAGTATLASTLSTAASGPVTIGCLRAGSHCLTNAVEDEVGIFGRVLSADELAGLASEGASGAVGAWRLDDTVGSTASGMTSSSADSGHYGPATAASASVTPSWTAGALGGAADFDGTDDIVSVATASGPTALNAGDFTASAWIWIDGFRSDGGGMRIVNDDGNNNGWGLVARGASSSASTVRLFLRGASPESLDTSAGTLESGRWNHVVGIRSGTTRKIYVNGVLKASDTFTGTVKSDAGKLSIGGDTNETAFFNGKIDQVELYDRVVSEKVLQAKAARSPRGASHFWALGEGSGTTTADAGQQTGSAASLVGGPSWGPGTIGRGLSFDGVDDEVQTNVPLAGSFSQLTVAGFVQTTDAPSNWNANMAILDYNRFEHFTLFLDDAGYPRFYTAASDGTRQECKVTSTTPGATPLNDGKRHHVAGTYNGSDKTIYVDGKPILTCANAHGGLPIGTSASTAGLIGSGHSTATAYSHFDGAIDEVWLDVTRALSASQIAALAHRSQNVQMQYDASGERVVKDVDGLKTISFFPSYEVRGGTEVRQYPEASAEEAGGTWLWAHPDHLGSATTVTSASGTAVRDRSYTAYGEPAVDDDLGQTAPAPSDGYTGQRADPETGLSYYGARYYDPVLGRFVSPDTYLDGPNRYAYAANNPAMYTDPSGHFIVPVLVILVGAALSAGPEAAMAAKGGYTDREIAGIVVAGVVGGAAAGVGFYAPTQATLGAAAAFEAASNVAQMAIVNSVEGRHTTDQDMILAAAIGGALGSTSAGAGVGGRALGRDVADTAATGPHGGGGGGRWGWAPRPARDWDMTMAGVTTGARSRAADFRLVEMKRELYSIPEGVRFERNPPRYKNTPEPAQLSKTKTRDQSVPSTKASEKVAAERWQTFLQLQSKQLTDRETALNQIRERGGLEGAESSVPPLNVKKQAKWHVAQDCAEGRFSGQNGTKQIRMKYAEENNDRWDAMVRERETWGIEGDPMPDFYDTPEPDAWHHVYGSYGQLIERNPVP